MSVAGRRPFGTNRQPRPCARGRSLLFARSPANLLPSAQAAPGRRWHMIGPHAEKEVGGMVDFTIETEIERAPAEVFACVTDPAKRATWQRTPSPPCPRRTVRCGWDPESGKSTERPAERRWRSSSRSPGTDPIGFWDCAISRDRRSRVASRLEPTGRGARFRFRVCGQPTGATRLVEPQPQIHPQAQLPARLHDTQTRPRRRRGQVLTPFRVGDLDLRSPR